MIKHPRQAFGISEDGTTLRLVHLVRDRSQVYLHDVDRVDLPRSLYQPLDEPEAPTEPHPWEDNAAGEQEITLDEFDSAYSPDVRVSPWETMFNSYYLRQGVIALNINEERLIRSSEAISGARRLKQYVKSQLSPEEYKSKDWQACQVSINQRAQLWLHKGSNQLLSLLAEYGRTHRSPLYYQLADANDIALTDYFRVNALDPEKRTLLVYLGEEYRRAYLFEKGVWITTLPLQITQKSPLPEIIYSKLALALDSAQLNDPEQIVLCGGLVNAELVEYLGQQYTHESVGILTFPNIVVNSQRSDLYEKFFLTQFALPLALAYKALYPDDQRYTHSNFLPHKTVEGQKTFKIAWHGLLVLGMIFLLALFGTISLLRGVQRLRDARQSRRELEHTLAQRRIEAAEIQRIRTSLEQQQKNIEVMRGILDGKNAWTEVLGILNRRFSGLPVSWLSNLKKDGKRLAVSGTTTSRSHILRIAESLPQSEIVKVTRAEIKDRTVWAFEIKSDLPQKDWIGEIEQDLRELQELKKQYGEDPSKLNQSSALAPKAAAAPASPQAATTAEVKSLAPYKGLSPIQDQYLPQLTNEMKKSAGQDLKDYYAFIASVNRGNMWEYRDLGVKFINKYPKSQILPLVRWHMAYRMYIDKEFNLVNVYNESLLLARDELYPWALLISARTDYARGISYYKEKYQTLKNDYARHPLSGQIALDLKVIEGGAR